MELKKIYITPEVEVMLMSTADVMRASEPSDTPVVPGVSGGGSGSGAPAHRTPVF